MTGCDSGIGAVPLEALVRQIWDRTCDRHAALLAMEISSREPASDRPIDVVALAVRLGLRLESRDIDAEAQLAELPAGPTIVTRANTRYPLSGRTRFSIAHEIGHFELRRQIADIAPQVRMHTGDPIEERFCNRFAAELLMPATAFSAAITGRPRPATVIALADRFQVSIDAAIHRLTGLKEMFVGIVWHSVKGSWQPRTASAAWLRDAVLCSTGRSIVEAAASNHGEQSGRLVLRSNGRQHRLRCVAMRLSEDRLVLTTSEFRRSTGK